MTYASNHKRDGIPIYAKISLFFIASGLSYALFIEPSLRLGTWNPAEQRRRATMNVEYREKLRDCLFRSADVEPGSIGYLSFSEQIGLWGRMGHSRRPFVESEGRRQFPEPTTKELERAAITYPECTPLLKSRPEHL
ncbi:MAG: hypothetical protein HYW25_02335 [Candidatus Aenigmarchaeota archaeon]|nr:hypothetical protein [Candidatus Aenigmarchaeota archaeon]